MIASQLYTTPPPLWSVKKTITTSKYQLLLMVPDRAERDDLAGYLKNIADVFPAKNEEEAIDVLKTRPVQLIIANGSRGEHDLCWHVKGSSRYAHIPVVELIPRDSYSVRLQCLESGADAWLEKPVSRHFLLAQVDNLITNRARIREHLDISNLAEPKSIAPSPLQDEVLWKRLNQVITQHLSNTALDIDLLASHLHMSRPTLYRKIADMSNMTPSDLITFIRLNNAAALLTLPDQHVTDIAMKVGFQTRNGFGKAFKKCFGMTPSLYRQKALDKTQQTPPPSSPCIII